MLVLTLTEKEVIDVICPGGEVLTVMLGKPTKRGRSGVSIAFSGPKTIQVVRKPKAPPVPGQSPEGNR